MQQAGASSRCPKAMVSSTICCPSFLTEPTSQRSFVLQYLWCCANQGLFGTVAGTAVIKNVKVAGTIKTLNTNGANIGSIVGVQKGGVIDNCESSVAITASGYNVGGIVGVSDGGLISNCKFLGNITSSSTAKGNSHHGIGAIVGYLSTKEAVEVNNCVNEGTITTGSTQVGGIVGLAYGISTVKYLIINCINNGDISSSASVNSTTNEGVGGIAGMALYTTIKNCENNGSITAKNACQVAGIVGKCSDNSLIENCENNGDIIGISQVGGISGRHVGGATANSCTNNGNIYCTSTATTYGQICGHNGATMTNCTENGSKGIYSE